MLNWNALPGRWEICGDCRGDGGSSAHLGSWSADEWADEDPDWRDDYLAGKFDALCPACAGSGKVKVPDMARIPFAVKREMVEARRADRWRNYVDPMVAAERRMGA